jgi:glycosyltransferase involved in cell wall biosynthesis
LKAASAIDDPRIRIIRQENQGVSAARNRGVDESQYDWVAFLDADDEWLPEFLEKMMYLKEKYPGCGLYGSAHYQVTFKNLLYLSTPISVLPFGWEGIFENYSNYIGDIIPFNSSSVLISKEALQQVGGFPSGIKLWEDTDTWMRLAIYCNSAFLNIPLSIYHLEAENRTDQIIIHERIKILEKWKKMILLKEIPAKYETSFKEFLARYQVMVVRSYLSLGQPQNARKILREIPMTEKYKEVVLKLQRWAKYPPLVTRVLLGFRYRSKRYADRIAGFLGLI